MKRALQVALVLVLGATLLFAGQERRAQKIAEEQAVAAQEASFLRATTPMPLGWDAFDIESATSRYKGIETLPGGVVWINGNDNGFTAFYGYRSVDNGATWKKFTLSLPIGNGVTNIAAKDSSVAVIGSNAGILYRTTNGGASWDSVFSYDPNLAWMDAVKCVGTTRDTMIAFGDADNDGVMVARSTDAGATWTRLTNLPATDSITVAQSWIGYYTYGQCMATYGSNIWISLYWGSNVNPRMLVSTDGGDSWSVHVNILPGGPSYDTRLHSINFLNENVGWGVCRGLSSSSTEWAVKTTDGGKTWSDTISVDPSRPHNDATPRTVIPIPGTNTVFAGGYGIAGAKGWWSTDGGSTWADLGFPTGATASASIYNGSLRTSTDGFAIGREINLKLSGATAIGDEGSAQPEGFALSQNYPNPFNPSTTIDYAIPSAASVQLKVYDMLGREVATLVQADQAPGAYSVRFDGRNLSSGVYYYTLKAGAFVSTKTLILLK